jgi:hypothetical protein
LPAGFVVFTAQPVDAPFVNRPASVLLFCKREEKLTLAPGTAFRLRTSSFSAFPYKAAPNTGLQKVHHGEEVSRKGVKEERKGRNAKNLTARIAVKFFLPFLCDICGQKPLHSVVNLLLSA